MRSACNRGVNQVEAQIGCLFSPQQQISLCNRAVNRYQRARRRVSKNTVIAMQKILHLSVVAHTNTYVHTDLRKSSGRRTAYRTFCHQFFNGRRIHIIDMCTECIADEPLCTGLADITQPYIADIDFHLNSLLLLTPLPSSSAFLLAASVSIKNRVCQYKLTSSQVTFTISL